ncbi:hypothetical protein [Stenotrophomonas sp.]|uniref:hypothetical protein n=1 Tax=Stenotrophomonas sp. TaxID=69392 RepID=UPI0028B1EFDE|nr:hypothetical protein [Stenotrophomonas sp.]
MNWTFKVPHAFDGRPCRVIGPRLGWGVLQAVSGHGYLPDHAVAAMLRQYLACVMRLVQRHRAWDRHLQRLVRVRVRVLVEADSTANSPQGMCLAPGAMPMPALLPQHSYHPFHHPVLLGGVGCDEFLFQPWLHTWRM